MIQAKVKWFNDARGYGYAEADGHPDVFCHYTAIDGDGFKTLAEEQVIWIELVNGPKGPQAGKILKRKPEVQL